MFGQAIVAVWQVVVALLARKLTRIRAQTLGLYVEVYRPGWSAGLAQYIEVHRLGWLAGMAS